MFSDSHQSAEAPVSSDRKSIARNLAHYTPSILFKAIVGVLNTLIRPKLLNPHGFGLWSLLNIITEYTTYLQLGSRDYMRFAIPRLAAAKEEKPLHEVEASAFWGVLAPNLGVALALLAVAVFSRFETDLRVGLVAMAALVILTCIYEHCVNLMKGHQLFKELSRGMYMRNACQLVLSVLLMLWLGIYGLFIAIPLSMLIALFYLRTCYPFEKVGKFSWSMYREMVREGFPLSIFAFLMTMMMTTGRLLVASYLTTEELGYYALSAIALSGLLDFPGAAREVIEPRMMEEAHILHRPEVLDSNLYRPLAINACYLPLMITPLYFMTPPLIRQLLPLYTRGIAPVQIILFGFFFLAVFYPMRGILVALRLQKDAALLMILCVLINIGFSLIALKAGFGIIGVTVANSASYAALLFLMAALLRWRGGIHFSLVKVCPVFVSFALLCAGIGTSQTWLQPHVGQGFAGAITQSAVLLGTGLVLVTIAEQRIALLQGTSPLSILRLLLNKIRTRS